MPFARKPDLTSPQNEADRLVPVGIRVAAAYAWRLIVIGIAAWGLMRVIGETAVVGIPVAVALLLTGLLMPVTVLLNHRLGLNRHLSATITVVGFLIVVVGLLSLAGTQLVSGINDVAKNANIGVDQIQNWLATGPLHVGGEQLSAYIESGRTWLKENSQTLSSGVLRAGGTAAEFFAGIIIALITTFFFLAEGDRIWSWLVRLLPEMAQEQTHEAFRRGFVTLGSYAKTQCLVAAVDAVFITLGAWALGLPLLIPMGLIIFFGSFIPIIGAFVAGGLAVLVALVIKGPAVALIMFAIIIAVQQIEGHLLQPVLMSKAVALHPLAVILGVGLGSFLMGMAGALFAVPLLAVANTVLNYYVGNDAFPELAKGASAVANSPKKLAGEKVEGLAVDPAEIAEDLGLQPDLSKIGQASPKAVAAEKAGEDAARAALTDADVAQDPPQH